MNVPRLPEPYQSLIDSAQINSCQELLERDGLEWLFNLQAPQIMRFFPLIEELSEASLRLTLMRQAMNPERDANEFSAMLEQFKRSEDLEGAAACVMLALGDVLEESYDFSRFGPLLDLTESLLATGQLSPLAQAALTFQICWIEIVWQCDLDKVNKLLPEALRLAELARSPAIILMCSALSAYVYGWQGNLAATELLLNDAAPFLSDEQVSPLVALQYRSARGLLLTLQGDTEAAKGIYERLLQEDVPNYIPNAAWFLVHGNYLHCLVCAGDKAKAEQIAKIMLARTIPEQLSVTTKKRGYLPRSMERGARCRMIPERIGGSGYRSMVESGVTDKEKKTR